MRKVDTFVACAELKGFSIIYQLPFFGTDKRLETMLIMWHPDGILLRMDTFMYSTINTADIYCNFKLKEGGSFRDLYWGGSTSSTQDGIAILSRDVRDNMWYALEMLREQGTFLSKWVERPFLWLLHHGDTKVKNYNSKEINAERIKKFPRHVIDAITP